MSNCRHNHGAPRASGVPGGCSLCYWGAWVLTPEETRLRYASRGAETATPTGAGSPPMQMGEGRAGREARERRERAIELMARGATREDICKALGVGDRWIEHNYTKHADIRRAVQRYGV